MVPPVTVGGASLAGNPEGDKWRAARRLPAGRLGVHWRAMAPAGSSGPDDWWSARLPERQIDYHVRVVTRAGAASRRPLVYVATPKAACTTLKATLWRWHLRDADCVVGPEVVHRQTDATFRAPRELGFRAFMAGINAPGYVRLCFVRNPYTRLLSCYLNKIVGRNAAGRLRKDGLAFDERGEGNLVVLGRTPTGAYRPSSYCRRGNEAARCPIGPPGAVQAIEKEGVKMEVCLSTTLTPAPFPLHR